MMASFVAFRETTVNNPNPALVEVEKGASSSERHAGGVKKLPAELKGKEKTEEKMEKVDKEDKVELTGEEYFYDIEEYQKSKATVQTSKENALIQSLMQQMAELKALVKKEGVKPTGRENILELPETVKGIPNRVKLPNFTLYEGSSNPESHLDSYVTRMKAAGVTENRL